VAVPVTDQRPIGVFDSGVGGLSILKALRQALPHENFVYLADSGHAPYGERTDEFVIERAHKLTEHLRASHQIQALVIACNTATAAAVHLLRLAHPDLPIIGVEPALKPALGLSRTGRIGVMATRSTLGSAKFKALRDKLGDQAEFVCQACDGLARAIEHEDSSKIIALSLDYTRAMGIFGNEPGQIDTLVLGCTHYPFIRAQLAQLVGPAVQLLDNGEPVARQTSRVLPAPAPAGAPGQCQLLTTGEPLHLHNTARQWLGLTHAARPLAI
jgi:glutamate racemase